MFFSLQNLAVLGLLLIPTSRISALNPVVIKGYKFFDSETGEEFLVRGIDYYPRPNTGDLDQNSVDYYTDEHQHIWKRDIPYFQELGVNAIRLYAVDPVQNHDAFMGALNAAGIYAVVALTSDCPTCAITRDEAPNCYPVKLKQQGETIINSFAHYPNTLAFSAGNEVNHFTPIGKPEWNGPCQKKFLRDMRAFIASCPTMRNVPVGLVVADSERDSNALYYNCHSNPQDPYQSAEWFGLNSYVFCNGSAETLDDEPGGKDLVASFRSYKYSIPVVLTEFGCLSDTFPTIDGYEGQRKFLQAKWLLEDPAMLNQFSGGFAFEYSIEMENAKGASPFPFQRFGLQNFGIGYFHPENCDDIDIPCEYSPLPSFENLKMAYFDASNVASGNLTLQSFKIPADRQDHTECPTEFPPIDSFDWEADKVPDIQCPRSKPLPHNFVPETTHFPFLACFVYIVSLVSGLIVLGVIYYYRKKQKGNVNIQWKDVVIINGINSDEDIHNDSSSEESTGLLSMKKIGEDFSQTPYHSIPSDVSL